MSSRKIITGQNVSEQLKARVKELRQQMTSAESKLWQRLRANRLEGFHFRRQQVIDNYIVDFYCHAAGLVVEVDGGIHLEQEIYDRERDEYLTRRGLKVLRFLNSEVEKEMESVLALILRACQAGSGAE